MDLATAQEAITQALVATTRSVTSIAAEDVDFHRTSDPSIGQFLDHKTLRLLRLTGKLLSLAASGEKYHLRDVDAIEFNWRRIVDAGDCLFEQADTCLDEYTGLVKRADPQDAPRSPTLNATKSRRKRLENAYQNPLISKPQLLFEDAPPNHATEPFRPFLTSKPHAIVPLEQSFEAGVNSKGAVQYQHPYLPEIQAYQYPPRVYSTAEPVPYSPFDLTKATFVDDLDGVAAMLEELKRAKEIAIDLEHHEAHSYIGMVSLMQISTRDHDWVVDTLKPWRRKLQLLNDVFANPNILKVMHGAHMDVIWLQRDLGLYVVGLFDTHHASRVLGYPGGSLAFLLKKFIDFDAQKQYQTADWRLRPLPKEMLKYARSDTHFLLYVYDRMRNELIAASCFHGTESDRILEVLDRSKEYATQRYEHSFYSNELNASRSGSLPTLSRYPLHMSPEQFAVFAKIHKWRDDVARQEDESLNFILAHHVLIAISRAMPEDRSSLLGLIHPVSRPVWLRIDELLNMITDAKVNATKAPVIDDVLAHPLSRQHSKPTQPEDDASGIASVSDIVHGVDGSFRMHISRFWGAVWNQQDSLFGPQPKETYHILLCESQHDGEVRQGDAAIASQSHAIIGPESMFGAQAGAEYVNSANETHQVLGKRKANQGHDPEDPDTGLADPKLNGHVDTEEAMERVRKRAARKAKKKAKKSRQDDVAQGNEMIPLETTEPFDYEKAQFLLHAPKGQDDINSIAGRGFNPFAKAADAPPGLPRSQNPGASRSSTFK